VKEQNIVLCFFIYFILSVSWYLLEVKKSISMPLMLVVLAVNTLKILMLSGSLVRPIRFRFPVLNYIQEYTSHWHTLI
jgi:hypothetical protein